MVVAMVLGLSACGDDGGLPPTSALHSIAISPDPMVAVGSQLQLSAIGTYDDGTTADLTDQVAWIFSPPIATISRTGVLVGTRAGDARIIATLGNTRTTVPAVIAPAELFYIRAISETEYLAVDTTAQLFAIGEFSDGEHQIFDPVWTSDHPEHIQVSPTGTATALSAGGATLTASRAGITSAPVKISALDYLLPWVEIASGPLSSGQPRMVLLGAPLAFNATSFDPIQQELIDVTSLLAWSSSDPSVATVTPDGVLTPKSLGVTVVSAARERTATLIIFVIDSDPLALEVSVADTVRVGDRVQAWATAQMPSLFSPDVTRQATWSSSAPDVAVVSDTGATKGAVSALGPGTATLTATLADRSSSVDIVVEGSP